jgi:diguanylate cyclase (GGDEF)-like protein
VPGSDEGAVIGLVVSASDVTAERDQAAWLIDKVTHDWLTGLFNRPQFLQFLSHALDRVRRQPRHPAAVFFIDVDNLKATNDTHGHDAGDRLLRAVAARVTAAVRPADVVARYGGDEFAVLLNGCELDEAENVVERLRQAARPGQSYSAGAARWDGTESASELIARADGSLYRAKAEGRNRLALASA